MRDRGVYLPAFQIINLNLIEEVPMIWDACENYPLDNSVCNALFTLYMIGSDLGL